MLIFSFNKVWTEVIARSYRIFSITKSNRHEYWIYWSRKFGSVHGSGSCSFR